jgi:hypothetical protein
VPVLSFGLMAGQPTGLQLQARVFERHGFLLSSGFDFFHRGIAVAAEYRATVWTWEFVRYDATTGLVAGLGARVGLFEPYRKHLREFPLTLGLKAPVGLTLTVASLPLELGAYVSPLGFDFKAFALPRWRPEFALEARVLFPPFVP